MAVGARRRAERILIVVVPRAGHVEVLADVVLESDPGDVELLVVRERAVVRERDPVTAEPGEARRDRQRRIRERDVLVAAGRLPWAVRVAGADLPGLVVADRRGKRVVRRAMRRNLGRAQRTGGDRVLLPAPQRVDREAGVVETGADLPGLAGTAVALAELVQRAGVEQVVLDRVLNRVVEAHVLRVAHARGQPR